MAQDSAATLFKGGPVHVVWLIDLAIDFSPMADSHNIDNSFSVIDAVNHPIVANSDTP